MDQKIFIHIGYPKTGTTTLQSYIFPKLAGKLEANYFGKRYSDEKEFKELTSPDVYLFRNMLYRSSKEELEKQREEIRNRFDFNKFHSLIVSDEGYIFDAFRHRVNRKKLITNDAFVTAEKLCSFFRQQSGSDPQVLMMIRRQDSLIPSIYAQAYAYFFRRIPELSSLDLFINEMMRSDSKYRHVYLPLYYSEVAKKYCSLFGKSNVKVIPFELLKEEPEIFLQQLSVFFSCDLKDLKLEPANMRFTSQGWQSHLLTYYDIVKMKLGSKVINCMPWFLSNYIQKRLSQIIYCKPEFFKISDSQRDTIHKNFRSYNSKLQNYCDIDLSTFGYY